MRGRFIGALLPTIVLCLGGASVGSAPKLAETLAGDDGKGKVWQIVEDDSYQGGTDKNACKPGETWTFFAEYVVIRCGNGTPRHEKWGHINSRLLAVGSEKWEISYPSTDCEKERKPIRLTYAGIVGPLTEPQATEKSIYTFCPKGTETP